jgi:hypothetical protein
LSGFKTKPKGYTQHHHQDGIIMQLSIGSKETANEQSTRLEGIMP